MNAGTSWFGPLICPYGRVTGVPDTTTDDARPLYPMGMCNQFGGNAFSAPRNIVPTLVAWFLLE